MPISETCEKILRKRWFEPIIQVLVLLDTAIVASCPAERCAENWILPARIFQSIILILFIVESLMKVVAKGPILYFRSGWNRFDLVVLLASVPSLLITSMNLIPLRSFRMLKLFRKVFGIRNLGRSLKYTAKLIGSMLLLFAFLFLVFAVVGQQFFSQVDFTQQKGIFFGFRNFPISLLTVFSVVTTDAWTDVMFGVSSSGSWVYFILLIFTVTFLAMSLPSATIAGVITFVNESLSPTRSLESLPPCDSDSPPMMENKQLESSSSGGSSSNIIATPKTSSSELLTGNNGNSSNGTPTTTTPTATATAAATTTTAVVTPSRRPSGSSTTATTDGVEFMIPRRASFTNTGAAGQKQLLLKQSIARRVSMLPGHISRHLTGWTLQDVRNHVKDLVSSNFFKYMVLTVVLANTVLSCILWHSMPSWLYLSVEYGTVVCVLFFVLELSAKAFAYGVRAFCVFDTLAVVGSCITVTLWFTTYTNTPILNLSAVRVIQILALFPIARDHAERMTNPVSVKATVTIILFTFLFWVIAAVIGMQLFGGRMDTSERENFDSFWEALISVFSIMTTENWTQMLQATQYGTYWWLAPFYFILVLGISNYIILNLFIAVILNNFQMTDTEKRQKQDRELAANLLNGQDEKTRILRKRESDLRTFQEAYAASSSQSPESNKGTPASLLSNTPNRRPSLIPNTNPHHMGLISRHSSVVLPLKTSSVLITPALPRSRPSSVFDRIASIGHSHKTYMSGEMSHEFTQQRGLSVFSNTNPGGLVYDGDMMSDNNREGSPFPFPHYNMPTVSSNLGLVSTPTKEDGSIYSLTSPKLDRVVIDGYKTPLQSPICSPMIHMTKEIFDHEQQPHQQQQQQQQEKVPIESTPLMIGVEEAIVVGGEEVDTNSVSAIMSLIVNSPVYNVVVSILVLAGCGVLLLVERNPSSQLSVILLVTDAIMAGILIADVLLRFLHQRDSTTSPLHDVSFWADPWNRLDLFVTIMSVLSVGGLLAYSMAAQIGLVWSGRVYWEMMRAFRPLRLLQCVEGIKNVLRALAASFSGIFHVALLWILTLLFFCIWGVQLFAGKLSYCSDPSVLGKAACVGDYLTDDLILHPRVWMLPAATFEHIGSAALSLLQVLSFQNWQDVMHHSMDIVGLDQQPLLNSNPWSAVYFIVFGFVMGFFIIQLVCVTELIGVLAEKFSQREGSAGFTKEQQMFIELTRLFTEMEPDKAPPETKSSVRLLLQQIVATQAFQYSVFAIIGLNTLFMCLEFVGQPQKMTDFIDVFNILLLVAYLTELVMKCVADGPLRFIRNPWNIIDVLIVTGFVVGIGMGYRVQQSWVRVFRILRVVRLITFFPPLHELFRTFVRSWRVVVHSVLLLLVLFLIYGVIGVHLWGNVKLGNALDNDSNFQSVSNGLLSLFIMSTGQNWHMYMYDCMVQFPLCTVTENGGSDCGNSVLSIIYFVSFYILTNQVFVKLLVVAMLGNFTQMHYTDDFCINIEDLRQFRAQWLQATNGRYMRHDKIDSFLRSLTGNLAVADPKERITVLLDVGHKVNRDRVRFKHVLFYLVVVKLGLDCLQPYDRRFRAVQLEEMKPLLERLCAIQDQQPDRDMSDISAHLSHSVLMQESLAMHGAITELLSPVSLKQIEFNDPLFLSPIALGADNYVTSPTRQSSLPPATPTGSQQHTPQEERAFSVRRPSLPPHQHQQQARLRASPSIALSSRSPSPDMFDSPGVTYVRSRSSSVVQATTGNIPPPIGGNATVLQHIQQQQLVGQVQETSPLRSPTPTQTLTVPITKKRVTQRVRQGLAADQAVENVLFVVDSQSPSPARSPRYAVPGQRSRSRSGE